MTQPSFKRAHRIRGQAPYQAYLFAIDRCFKMNLATFYLKLFDPPNFQSFLLHFLCLAPGWLGWGSIFSGLKKLVFFLYHCKTFTKMQNTWPVPLMMSDFEKYELTSMSWLLPIFAICECFQSYSFCFTSPLMIDGVNYFKIPEEAFFVR